MRLNRTLLIIVACCFQFSLLRAQYSNIEFIENKGQWSNNIKFFGQVNAGAFYVQKDGFMVIQHSPADWARLAEARHGHGVESGKTMKETSVTVHSHAYKVEFLNGKQNPEIIADKPLPGYNNYFIGNDPSKWASDCKVYQGITVKNIYPNVDVRYYSNSGAVKYDLVVKPGGDISRIALKYHGADKLEIKNKELVIGTSVGNLKELDPYSFQQNENGRREIICKYKLKNDFVSFDVKDYDPSSTLVIDPY